MKPWQHILLGSLLALLSAAVIYLIAIPPRGEPVELLPPPTPAPIVVDVAGAVRAPGVYALPPGSRVLDAMEAAGGLSEDADPAQVNLAKKLRDGDKVFIPALGEIPPPAAAQNDAAVSGAFRVNINTATQQELETLPGIGPTRALDIIAYREENGSFENPEDLLDVPGIGETTFEELRELISVE